jgi:hypothetical protein
MVRLKTQPSLTTSLCRHLAHASLAAYQLGGSRGILWHL